MWTNLVIGCILFVFSVFSHAVATCFVLGMVNKKNGVSELQAKIKRNFAGSCLVRLPDVHGVQHASDDQHSGNKSAKGVPCRHMR
jgi:hypothetical protein